MKYYELDFFGIKRRLSLVKITPKLAVASVDLLGDGILVEKISKEIRNKLKNVKFDYLIGPEVKVVPVLQEVSRLMKKERYIVCRKSIHAYMISPISSKTNPPLILNGKDANLLKGKNVVVLDDVVSSGKTIMAMNDLVEAAGGKIVKVIAIFKQQGLKEDLGENFVYLSTLPTFSTI